METSPSSRRTRSVGRLSIVLVVVLVSLLVSGVAAVAQTQTHSAGLPWIQSSGRLAYAVSVSGDRAVVGAQWRGGFMGAAYVLRSEDGAWAVEQRLSPAGLGRFDHFGGSVAINGEYVVVGAPWHDLFRGKVYVFRRVDGVWTQVQELTASDAQPEREFGRAVSISDGAIRVRDGREKVWTAGPEGVTGAGEVTIYEFVLEDGRWVEQKRLRQRLTLESAWGAIAGGMSRSGATAQVEGTEVSPDEVALTGAILAAVQSVGGEEIPVASAEAPPAPAWVTATNGTLEDRVDILWASVGMDAVIYNIYRDSVLIGVASSEDSLYSDRAATLVVSHEYCVVVEDMFGQMSDTSACAEGKRVIFPPIGVSATDGEYVDRVEITWVDMSTINTGYLIRRDSVEIGTTGANGFFFVDNTAVAETTYTYEVVATVTGGYESEPGQDTGWRGVILPPKNVQASDGQYPDFVRIAWEAQGLETLGYTVYRDSVQIGSTDPGVTQYDDSTAVAGVTCTYCVAANVEIIGVLGTNRQPVETLSSESVWRCDEGGVGLAAPGSVSASDSTYDDRIRVTWRDLCKLEDGYEVSRAAFGDTLVLDTTRASATLYDDFAAGADTTFTYLVRAVHSLGGVSPCSSDVGYRSLVLAPTEVSATDGAFENYTNITWASTSTTVALFKVYRDGTFIKSVSKGERSYQDYGGTAGHVYDYIVSAMTSQKVEAEGLSDEGSRALKAPSQVNATDEAYEDRVVVSWADNSTYEQGYVVIREDTLAAESDTTYLGAGWTSLSDYTGVPGVTYKYWVAAFDTVGGATGYSAPAVELGRRVLLAPTRVRADDGVSETEVEITWVDNSNAEDGYRIYRKASPSDSTLVGSTGDNHTKYVDTLPVLGEKRQYSVAAFDSYGESAVASDSGHTTILAPVSFNASDFYEDGIELTWVDRSSIEQGFKIYRDGELIATLGSDTTSYADSVGLSAGRSYEYYVEAYNGTLKGQSPTETGSIYVPQPPQVDVTELASKLLANDGAVENLFGKSVAVSGDRAIVGASGDDDNGTSSGSAYVFERDAGGAWTQKTKLTASDGAAGDWFGYNVAISGDRVIVGAYRDDDNGTESGSAYVFERDAGGAWTEKAKLTASDGVDFDYFGESVAISGDRAIVGASGDDDNGASSGSAYVFERDTVGAWTQKTKLTASDGDEDDRFGESVAISGDRAIVRASGDDDNGTDSGSAYVFERDAGAWTEKAKVLASDGDEGDQFGCSVAISGDRAIVGAPYHDDKGSWSGSAYVFERDAGGAWTEKAKVLASDGDEGDRFGWSVAISGDRAIVGAPYDKANGVNSGSAYVAEFAASAYAVSATDGTLKSRVRITWEDHSANERGFRVYRDGAPIGSVEPNVEVYEDFDAEPGRTYQYGVATLRSDLSEELPEVLDFGWRPANGSVTGLISTRGGAASEGISVAIEPLPGKALLFDGAGGHVIVSGNTGSFGFTADSTFTVETWARYAGGGGSGADDGTMIAKASPGGRAPTIPFLLGNLRGEGEPGRVCFKIRGSTGKDSVSSVRSNLNDNAWHHLACVHDAALDRLILYVDGVLEGQKTYAGLGNIANTEPVVFGAGPDGSSWFGGQLDEVRIWNVALDSVAVRANMRKQLEGNEPGLLAYWPLDEGSSEEERQGGNAAVTDVASGAHYGVFADGVYWSESSGPLNIYPETDAEGNYVLRGIRYGTQATFNIRPFDQLRAERQFEPAYRVVTLTTEDPVENQVNFNDISSFTVSGVVKYEGTSCPATDVQIMVDDGESEEPGGVTDKNGKFAVSVDFMGDVDCTITPVLEGHGFVPPSYTLRVDRDTVLAGVGGVAFADTTHRVLSGRIGGSCGRSIGDVVITTRSETSCMVRADTVSAGTSSYSVSLPPQTYMVSAAVVESTIPEGLNRSDVVRYFQGLGERQVELADTSATLDFVYRAPLVVTITGMESFVTCDVLTFEGRELPPNLPVIPQGDEVILVIEVNEDYGAGGLCPLDSGAVTIYDEISDREETPVVLPVRGGEAVYRTFGNTPSLIVGRLDGQGNDRSFQKFVAATVTVEGRSPVTATEWALVTGHVAPEGADFITMTTEEMPFYILRDPPGDKSYAFLEQGYTSTSTIDFIDNTWTTFGEEDIVDVKVGFSARIGYVWLGNSWTRNFTTQVHYQYRSTEYETDHSTGATVVSTTVDEQFNTSADGLFTGGEGDVFVGAGLNYIFSEVGVVEVDEGCNVTRSKSVGFEPAGFKTVFAYTERHIADVLIPELKSKAEYYYAAADSDSAAVFEEMADNWRGMLGENDSLKLAARLRENRSFSAGADYKYAFTSDTTESYRRAVTLFSDDAHAVGFCVDLFGVKELDYLHVFIDHTVNVTSLTDTTGTSSSTVGYVLSDDDFGDRFTVDVKQDGCYPSPVFDVRAGASSCPYEPWRDASGKARMLRRDSPRLGIVPETARRDSVPADQAAVFTLQLSNHSETEEPRVYALRLLTTSNPYGAVVKVSGETIAKGPQQYLIAPGQTQEAALTVERGPTHYDYENLALILYAPCEYALQERGGVMSAVDTLYFSVTFKDRGPVVFGTPEPADGELSFGEDISVTFNETIDCAAVQSDSMSFTYLDGADAGSTFTPVVVCDGKTIILRFGSNVNVNDLEGRRLRAHVSRVQDRAGNMMAGAVEWEFVCHQSQFTWSEREIRQEVPYRNPGTIAAELVNGTKDPVEFSITEPPSWLTVSPSSGTIAPASKQSVNLTVSPDLVPGTHDSVVVAAATNPDQGVAVLDLHLTVSCQEPEWVVNPGAYQHSMTVVAELDIGGSISSDENDKVAAFVGNQLRGVAHVDSVAGLSQPNVAFLTVYSNRAQGETVRFQVWDYDSCRLYNSAEESYPFEANGIVGSPTAPVTLTATEIPADSTLTIAVSEGWTWISTNVLSGDMSVTGVLSDLTPSPGDIIKSQVAFSQFVDDTTGWSGGLTELDNASGYMLKLSEGGTIVHKGALMDTLHVPVVRYWNWVSYLPGGPMEVAEALDDLEQQGLLVDGDMVKSQTGFAQYATAGSSGWYGSLPTMEPGKGYKLYLQNASETPGVDAFVYPAYVPSPMPRVAGGIAGVTPVAIDGEAQKVVAAGEIQQVAGKVATAEGEPSWTVNHHAYQHNMTVTGVLSIGGVESVDERDMVGAFVGEECRGIARPVYVDGVRRYEVFLVVSSNRASGERVVLRAFDADAGVIYNVTGTLVFEADKVQGTVQDPAVFTAGSVWEGETSVVPEEYALRQNYPNPFNPVTTIGYDVPAPGGRVTIRVYDVAGRLVRTLVDGPQEPGRRSVVWDGRSSGGHAVATGVYIYRMTSPGYEKTLKMVMLK